MGNGGIAPRILNLGARRRRVVSLTPRHFTPGRRLGCLQNRLKEPAFLPVLSQLKPIHTLSVYFSKINANIFFPLSAHLPTGMFP